jgi:DNA-binding response OmpR family regulator
MRVLVVEDDPLLGRGVQVGLGQAGFAADCAACHKGAELGIYED